VASTSAEPLFEQVAPDAAGAAGIDQPRAARPNRGHVPPHGNRGSGDLLGRFPFGPERGQQHSNFVFGHLSRHDLVDDLGHFVLRKVVAGGKAAEVSGNHGVLRGGRLSNHRTLYRRPADSAGRANDVAL
jgi:hypothetical protein